MVKMNNIKEPKRFVSLTFSPEKMNDLIKAAESDHRTVKNYIETMVLKLLSSGSEK